MRTYGTVKIILAVIFDFALLYWLFGIEIAMIILAGIILYAWLGEYLALLRDGAISLKKLNDYEKTRLIQARECLIEDVRKVSKTDISKLKLHIIPSEDINAYAYGFKNVAITRAALNSCDDITLCSVLAHELSHIIYMDAVFNRIIFANVTLLMIGLTLCSFVSMSMVWIVFLILCLFGACGGIFSVIVFRGCLKLVKGIFGFVQRILVFVYQTVMGIVSRGSEFKADKYSCQLGYGPQLGYFLTRFFAGQESRAITLNEILYASHPNIQKRVMRIEQYSSKY